MWLVIGIILCIAFVGTMVSKFGIIGLVLSIVCVLTIRLIYKKAPKIAWVAGIVLVPAVILASAAGKELFEKRHVQLAADSAADYREIDVLDKDYSPIETCRRNFVLPDRVYANKPAEEACEALNMPDSGGVMMNYQLCALRAIKGSRNEVGFQQSYSRCYVYIPIPDRR